jgi:hypothetical protein
MLIGSLDTLKTIERVFAAKPGRATQAIVRQTHRQKARSLFCSGLRLPVP